MQHQETTEPRDENVAQLQRCLQEWESVASQIIGALHDPASCDQAAPWRPHASQIEKAVAQFRALCSEASENLGGWREDGLAPDEVYELVWERADQLVKWMQRMTAE